MSGRVPQDFRIVTLDWDQFRPAEPSWAHGKMRTTGRVVPDRENSVFTFGSSPSGARVHWRAQAYGEFLSRNLSATLWRKRSLARRHGNVCACARPRR